MAQKSNNHKNRIKAADLHAFLRVRVLDGGCNQFKAGACYDQYHRSAKSDLHGYSGIGRKKALKAPIFIILIKNSRSLTGR